MKSFKVEKLDEIKSQAESEELDSGFMNPSKKRGGRRPGSGRKKGVPNKKEGETTESGVEASPEVQDEGASLEQIKKAVKPAIGAFDLVGQRLGGPKAAMTVEEMSTIVDAASACVQQYLPDAMGKHAALIIFGLALGKWGLKVASCRQEALASYNQKVEKQAENSPLNGGKPPTVDPPPFGTQPRNPVQPLGFP